MPPYIDLLFLLHLSFLVAHELDATHHREWRLLFVFRTMEEGAAARAFIGLHVPLVMGILWLSLLSPPAIRVVAQALLSGFSVVHLGLHWRLRAHEKNDMTNTLSWTLIVGAGVSAAAHLVALALG